MFRIFFALFAVAVLSAGAAFGPVFVEIPTDENGVVVYLYRPSTAINCCVAPNVVVDNMEVGALKNGEYIPVQLGPGKHVISTGNDSVDSRSYRLN